jgi:Protein of unknown function (DUF4240)
MTETEFWQLIEIAKKTDVTDFGEFCEVLTTSLIEHPVDDIIAFENILNKKLNDATTSSMLAACFIVNSYISDDTFEYFCAWLIGQGKSDYEQALADPNHICNLINVGDDNNQEGEYLTTVAVQAFEEKTHSDGDEFYDKLKSQPPPNSKGLSSIIGDDYKQILPQLFDKFWNQQKIDELYGNK